VVEHKGQRCQNSRFCKTFFAARPAQETTLVTKIRFIFVFIQFPVDSKTLRVKGIAVLVFSDFPLILLDPTLSVRQQNSAEVEVFGARPQPLPEV
jgi:hypothetical protein